MDALRMLSKSQGGADYEHEVERLLSCPICLEVYSKPVVILPCQHNLCRKCANDVFQNRGTPMGSGGRFRCPTCRYEVMLDRHGVYGLQRNLLVENIIDMYQSESKKPFRKVEVMMCEEHEDEKVNIFCVTCQKPTCSLCKVFGEHQSCTVAPVDKVFKDHKREISEAIAMLVAGNDRLQLVISRIEQLATNVEENSKTIQSDVCAAFDKLYSVLEDRKQNMLSRIKAATHEKNEVLQEMLKKYGEQLENSSTLVEESLALLEEPNVPQFLSTSRETINKVTATARATEVRKPPSNIQDMNAFVVDFSMHEAELSVIDFLDAGDENLCADDNDSVSERESTPSDVAPSTSSGGGFRAKLLLPKEEEQTEVIAEAEIKRERNDDDEVESDDTTSLTSRSDAGSSATGRRESSSSHADLKLENDVKAIAERYLSGKSSRPSSRFGSTGDSDSRHRNYSDEESLWKNW